jgi:hypothetical protein
MKAKHNKKRNTAFIFEALSREMTKAIITKDTSKRATIAALVKSSFAKGTELRKELDIYRELNESSTEDKETAMRIVQEAKAQHKAIDKDKLFAEQTALINTINKKLSKSVFSNFIGNYKHLATISQIFNTDANIKERILMENTVVATMTKEVETENMKSVDGVVYRSFVKSFNEQYSEILPEEQKTLLGKYISSFSDNGVEFKMYMNEEVGRLKEKVKESLDTEEIKADGEMTESTKRVYEMLEGFSDKPIDERLVEQVLNIQNFVKEVES